MTPLDAGDAARFAVCEICAGTSWRGTYRGAVRDGKFGHWRENALVARCGGCGADRLAEDCCLPPADYESARYWEKVDAAAVESYHADHDHLQPFNMRALEGLPLRGRAVADIGCAAGSFLDQVTGIAARTVAIEPSRGFHGYLSGRGHEVFPYASDAAAAIGGEMDLATSFQVIEHVENPRTFLEEIRGLLKPAGRLLLSTPNRDDILMRLLPDDFPPFFHRVVHRWYFDAESLARCAEAAGFALDHVRFIHRYGMANALHWLRDRQPRGNRRLDGLSLAADAFWQGYLEENGTADTLFMMLKPR